MPSRMVKPAAMVSAVLIICGSAWCQYDTTCLKENLPKLTSDDKMTLIRNNGSEIMGQFVSVSMENRYIDIHELYRSDRGHSSYSFS